MEVIKIPSWQSKKEEGRAEIFRENGEAFFLGSKKFSAGSFTKSTSALSDCAQNLWRVWQGIIFRFVWRDW